MGAGPQTSMPESESSIIGWDIGGAHVKAARVQRGALLDAAQWPCPLWRGVAELEGALAAAHARWPDLAEQRHAVTMTGEMVDAFANREDGVRRIAQVLGRALPRPSFFAGDAGWCGAPEAGATWQHIASANWFATARHAACLVDDTPDLELMAAVGLPALRAQCKRYAVAQVHAILDDPQRAAAVRAAFAEITGKTIPRRAAA